MKTWKKLFSAGMVFTAGLALTACGNSNNDDPASSGEGTGSYDGETLTIGVWGGNDAEEKSLDTLISNFEDETGATIEKKVYTEYNTQIQADMVGKTAPDAFYVDASMFPFFQSNGVLAELDPETFAADSFYSSLTDAFSADGTLYAIPKDMSTLALYLNTDIFDETGVSVDEIPNSYEAYIEWLPSFQEKIDEVYGEGKVFAMSYNQDLSRNYHLATRDGAVAVNDDGTANLSDEAVVDNLSILNDLVDTGAVVTPQDVGMGWNGEAFGTGKIAIMDEGNWVYQTLIDEYSDISFTVKQMPTYKEEEGSMMFSVGWGKYIGTEKGDLADQWIQYVTGVDGMTSWVKGTGTLPSREDVAEEAKITDNADLTVHLDAWDYATIWQKGTSLDTINTAYQNFLPEALTGKMTLEDAMKDVDEQANADINAAN